MWKKGSALLLAGMLALTGCAGEASLVRDSIVTTIDKPNYDFQATVKLTGDVDKLPELFDEPADEQGFAILNALKAGVTVKGSQLDLENAKMSFEANDDKLLRDNGLWSGDSKASIEAVFSSERIFVKSPLDSKYLLLDSGSDLLMEENEQIDPAKLQEFKRKVYDLTINFIKNYVSKYGYKLNNVENLGAATVQLPNGEKAETTHIAIKLDAKELVNMFFYTANDAVANEEVKKFAVDLLAFTGTFFKDQLPEEERLTEAEARKIAEEQVTYILEAAKEWLAETGKLYTADKIVEELKANGLHAIDWKLDFYVTKDKIPVQQVSELSVTFQNEDMTAPLTLGLFADQYSYNFGKAAKYEIPSADSALTPAQLYENPEALGSFSEKGFFRLLAESLVEDYAEQIELKKLWEEELEALEEAE